MSRVRALGVAGALAAAVFLVDLAVPTGWAIAVLYAAVVALGLRSDDPRDAPLIAGLCSCLAVADVFLGAQGAPLAVTATNRALSIAAIWLVAGLVHASRREQRAAALEREKSDGLVRALVEDAPDGLLVVDRAGTIRYANETLAGLFGYPKEELLGQPLELLLPEGSRARHRELFAEFSASPRALEMGSRPAYPGRRKDGSELLMNVRLRPLRVKHGDPLTIATVKDATETKKEEARLHTAQRLEAIGRLAGGIAHDFNNLLSVIMSCGRFLEELLPEDSPARTDIDDLLAAADRAAALTAQLLAFSRRQVTAPRPVDVNAALADAQRIVGRILGEDVEVSICASTDACTVFLDPTQLEQVVMNLAVNARDAMPRGGRLTIETSRVTLDEEYQRDHPEVDPGDYVMIAVSDTGEGMSEAVRSRIFEPFFTTKQLGRGTGLGLATVYGIVRQAKGHIYVYSEVGRGTVFKIYLPRSHDVPEVRLERPRSQAPGAGETVLVVEDEPSLRRVIVRILKTGGYSVLEAEDADDAVRMAEATGSALRLLVTDVVMPKLSGRDLARRIAESQPNLPVLYLSGYAEHAIAHHGVLDAGLAFLQKPFSADELLHRVRELLDGDPPSGERPR